MSAPLLRSVIDYDGGISQENLNSNYKCLLDANLEWTRLDDQKIFQFIERYFQQHLEVPQKVTVLDYFESCKDIETAERIKDLEKAAPYIRTNYAHLITTLREDQRKIRAITLFKEAQDIASKGIEIEGEKVHGVEAAITHLATHINRLRGPNQAKLDGNIRTEGQAVWDEYAEIKRNPSAAFGNLSGINPIDVGCRGIKRGNLWIHAGFAGELKTCFALNWSHNLVTRYRNNVFYISLEMTREHIRRKIYGMHSTLKRFATEGIPALDYKKIRDGALSPEQEAAYQVVISDFNNNPEYGSFDVWRPAEDVTVDDIRARAEGVHRQTPLGLIVIDHGGLVEPRKKKKRLGVGDELNSVVRDAKKRLALDFNGGEGVPVLLLWQLNRQGKDAAEKADGVYKMSALSYANEAERSADVVTTTYLDDRLRERSVTKFCNLKNRDDQLFPPFEVDIDFKSGRISNVTASEKKRVIRPEDAADLFSSFGV
jgi:replicative DNA helicase